MKKICVFGASGSIGQSTIELVRANPDKFKIVGASAGQRFSELEAVAAEMKIEHLLDTRELDPGIDKNTAARSRDLIKEFIKRCEPDIVLNAVSGFAGLPFTHAALELGLPLALANKESLVAAGDLVMALSREHNAPIIPVDSEHSAIFQCLACPPSWGKRESAASSRSIGGDTSSEINYQPFKKIYLTCSGGPFFGQTDLSTVTREQALKHPNWSMGSGITVDSATLANKCLEFFEAMHLFNARPEQIEIVVHPQSVVHSMVQFADSSIIAQLSPPDMKLPIAYALNWPQRSEYGFPSPDFSALDLNFRHPDAQTFRTLQVMQHCATQGGSLPTVFNAANEEARNAFIRGDIEFTRIFEILEQVVGQQGFEPLGSWEKIYKVDAQARKAAQKLAR